jgi:hypothetical protein
LTDSHPDGYLAVPADHDWAAARTAAGYSTLLIPPDPCLRLDVENIEVIRRSALALELPRSA